MPDNVLDVWGQLFSVVVGMLVLFGGALAFAVRHRMRVTSGSRGRRPNEEADVERVSPDGYIDSFADSISEAGGGMPIVGTVIIAITLVSYFAYLILFWQPR